MEVLKKSEELVNIKVSRAELAVIKGCLLSRQIALAWLHDGKDPGTWAEMIFRSKEPAFDLERTSEALSLVAELLQQVESRDADAVEVEISWGLIMTIVFIMQAEKQAIQLFLPEWKKLADVDFEE